jgi:hypothetical protein
VFNLEESMTLQIQDRRIQQRREFLDAITICSYAITICSEGISQVVDISSGGISFKCCCEVGFPERWELDIVDSAGSHLRDVLVEKVWEESIKDNNGNGHPSIYKRKVGVKFKHLSIKQQSALYELILQ